MLEMRDHCEKCNAALSHGAEAYICSYECTWCPQCSAGFQNVCPNCGGELIRRPKRRLETSSCEAIGQPNT